jgi:hypothetical protein
MSNANVRHLLCGVQHFRNGEKTGLSGRKAHQKEAVAATVQQTSSL